MALEKIRPRVVDETGNYTFNNVTATGTLVSANANLGNIARANFVSTDHLLYANGVAWSIGTGSVVGTDTQVQFNDGGTGFGASSAFTFNKTTSTLSVTNITANGAGLTSITGANVTGFVPNATYATSAGTATSATTAGTVTASSQPNINSVGTLNSLTFIANGNITMSGSLSQLSGSNLLSANYIIGNGYYLTSTAGGNVVGQVTYAGTANSVAGANVVGAVTYAATANAVSGSNVFGQVANALVAGTVYEPSQTNITQVGTLVSLTAGNINLSYTTTSTANLGNVVRSNYFIGDGSGLTGITVSGAYSNTNASAYLATATFTTTGNISANVITATTFVGNGSGITYIAGANVSGNVSYAVTSNWSNVANSITGTNVSGNVTSAVQAHYANIANSVTFTNVSGKPTTISGYGITDAYSNTNAGAYLSSYSGDLTSANITITGNLIVGGTTTSVNSTVTRIVDPIIELGANANGATLTSDDNKDRGLLLHYYSGSTAVDAFMGWDDSNVEFGVGSNVSVTSEVVTWNSYGNIRAAYFKGDGSQLTNISSGAVTGAYSNTNTAAYLTANPPTGTYSNSNVAAYLPTYAGNFTAGNINLSYTTTSTANLGNAVRANYFVGNAAYLTGVDLLTTGGADAANYIANGNSNINTPYLGGPITVGIGGTANTVIFAKTGNYITTPGNISANYLFGNGYFLDGVTVLAASSADTANNISNGSSNISTPYASGPIPVAIAGIANTVVFNSTGVNVTGYANIGGSVTAGTGTGGSITGANAVTSNFFLGNGTYLSSLAGANVSGNVGYAVTSNWSNVANSVTFANVSGKPTTISGYGITDAYSNTNTAAYLTANPTAGTYSNTNVSSYLTANPPTGTYSNSNVASYLPTYTGSLTAGNINLSYTTTSTANLGNAVIANYIIGNGFYLTNVDTSPANISNSSSNVQVYTAGPVTTSIGGTANILVVSSTGITVTGSAIVGNLTVTGTTTTVNSTTTRIVDPVIELGGGANGAALTVDDNKDRGLVLHYYSGSAPVDAFMGWDDSNVEFAFASNATLTGEVTTFNAFGNIRAAYFKGDGSGLTNIGSPANIYSGTSNVNIPTASSNVTVSVAGTANTVVFTNSGNYIVTTGNVKAGYYFGDGSQLTGITAVAGTNIVNVNSNVNIPAANSNVTISVNNTPNVVVVTSTGVNVAGTLNVTGVSTLGPAGNVRISGAPTSGYILTSDGSGALAWASSGTVAAAISQSSTTLTILSSTLTISLASYVSFEVTLNATISTVTLTNVPSAGIFVSFVLMITGDGTARAITWPVSFKWPNGTAPSITSTLNKKDVFVFFTTDGGTTWEAMISGQNL